MNWKRFYTIGNNLKQVSAFSLIELVVSVALFTIIMLSATQIFKLIIDSQRNAIASQNVEESLKYFLEVTAKEIRMAQRDKGVCINVPDNKVFAVSSNSLGDILYFKNFYGECVKYYIVNADGTKRFVVDRNNLSDYISPAKISIDKLNFVLDNTSKTQPTVTINLEAHALNQRQFKSNMIIQTTLSSRYYKG